MWSAELLVGAIKLGAPQNYESLWQQEYRLGLVAASANLPAGTSSGVVKSTDGGGNWGPGNTGLNSLWVDALVIDPDTPFTLNAGLRALAGLTCINCCIGHTCSSSGMLR